MKEEERVNLELEMTEVKESLKKALSGGVTLGLTIQPKSGSSGLQVRRQMLKLTLGGICFCCYLNCLCTAPPVNSPDNVQNVF